MICDKCRYRGKRCDQQLRQRAMGDAKCNFFKNPTKSMKLKCRVPEDCVFRKNGECTILTEAFDVECPFRKEDI